MKRPRLVSLLAAAALAAASSAGASECLVITGAFVSDGSGRPLRRGSIRVCGEEIQAVGTFRPGREDRVVSGRGLVAAPGFIDIHNHSTDGLAEDPLAESQISQRITTLVVGADGESPWPLSEYLDARRQLSPPST
ncbi:MAG: hypothetical protein LC796_13065 [Acidobacteria bacterium]|nr:hypothetical protein [Acidobacteriota bacterium]MCA1612067.1 hypothetical protein [Acidobacteriota bacterium]